MAPKKIKNLDINYDQEADIFHISFGKTPSDISIEVQEGNFVRIDPQTDDVVGITLLNFKKRFMPSPSKTVEESEETIVSKILDDFTPPFN
jgi:uncharacterized protein YuzE